MLSWLNCRRKWGVGSPDIKWKMLEVEDSIKYHHVIIYLSLTDRCFNSSSATSSFTLIVPFVMDEIWLWIHLTSYLSTFGKTS